MLLKLFHLVLPKLQAAVDPRSRDVWSAHQAMQDSHLCDSRDLGQFTRSGIITTASSVQLPFVWDSVLPQPDNPCNGLALLIQYPELQSYYCMVCCCEIWACLTHFGCSYKHRGIWWMLEFELHFCALFIAHFHIHLENIQMIPNKVCEPPLQMRNLAWQRTK